ncbi:MAG: hemolysin family protein [Bacteroidia bacterium]
MLALISTAIILLLCSFFFSGVEIAFLSSSRLKMEVRLKNKEDRAARLLADFKKSPASVNWVLTTILVGNNLALVGFAMAVESGLIASPGMGPLEQILNLEQEENALVFTLILSLISTPIVLIFAEFIPKAIFKTAADRLIYPSVYLLRFFYGLFYLPVWIINGMVSGIQYMLGLNKDNEDRELGMRELGSYLRGVFAADNEDADVSELDREMFANAIAFRETKAKEFMIPRTEIEAVPIDTSLEELLQRFIETKLSKLIVYGESLDDIQGYVHSMSLFEEHKSLTDAIQEVLIAPESMLASNLLADFNDSHKTLAIIVDEFGGTAGLVTMEDLVEEIFGDIEDEYDKEEVQQEEDLIMRKNADGSYLLGARLEIDDINEDEDLALESPLPEDEAYTTLGGLFIHYAEMIPEPGHEIEVGPWLLKALEVAPTRIVLIELKRVEEQRA